MTHKPLLRVNPVKIYNNKMKNMISYRLFLFLRGSMLMLLFLSIPFLGYTSTFTSVITGDWDDGGTWGNTSPGVAGTDYPAATDNATILAGTNVSLTSDETIVNLIIQSGGILDGLTNNNELTINGTLDVDGTLKADNKDIIFTGGVGTSIDGIGTIFMNNNGKKFKIFGNTSVLSTANLNLFGKIEIQNSIVVTNNGIVKADDDIQGKDGNSEWINAVNSVVNARKKLMSTGKLTASANGNSVSYYGDNQDVTTPVGSTYYDLISSGKASKTNTQLADLIITNDLIMIGGTYDCNNYKINIAGDWINSGGTFNKESATVEFDGAGAQAITTVSGETFYDWEISGGGTVTINGADVIIANMMTMTSGNINALTNKITLGISPATGTLTHVSGTIMGYFERWLSSSTGINYLFPVGTSANYKPANINFNAISNDGTITCCFINADPGNNGLSLLDGATTIYNTFVDGYWEFSTANSFAANDFDLDLTGNGFTAFTIDAATRILTRADAASVWLAEGSHVAAVGNTANRDNIFTIAGHYCFGDDSNCSAPTTPTVTSADTDPCTSTSGTYQVTNTGNTYAWSISPASAGAFNPAPAAGDFSVTIDWGTTGQVASVICIENNGCTNSAPDTLSVNVHSIAPSSMTGKRSVAKGTLGEPYSIAGLAGYTYTWTITDGTVASGQGSSSITVDWDNTLGTGQVSVVAQSGGGCTAAASLDVPVYRYEVINSNGSGGGDWNTATTWDCNCIPLSTDNVRILPNDTVTQGNYDILITHFIIQTNAALQRITDDKDITVSGDFTLDGLLTLGVGTKKLKLDGISTTIDGGGTINITAGGLVEIKTGHKTVSATAMITISGGDVDIKDAGIIVTNNGSITISGNLTFKDGTNNWLNTTNSTLNIGGDIGVNGVLTASSTGNTVNYNGAIDQNIVVPATSYFNLSSSTSNIKFSLDNLNIDGELLIQGTSQFHANGKDILIAGNWTNTSTNADPFVEAGMKVTFDGASVQVLTCGSGMESFENLTINKSANGIFLNDVVNIVKSGSMTLTSGVVTSTITNEVQFQDDALTIAANINSYVDGPVIKIGDDGFTFPIGNNGYFNPLSISSPSDLADEFRATYVNGLPSNRASLDPSLDHVSSVEYWDLERTVGTSSLFVTLFWNSTNSGVTGSLSDLAVAHYDSGTSEWENMGGLAAGGPTAGNVLSMVLMTSFSPLTLGSKTGSNPLPIELISFEANANEDEIDIKWITATEINNDYFTVERSVDAKTWEEVVITSGAGNSNQTIEYFETDYEPLTDISYYRLKQTDFNGEYSYSNIVPVKFIINNPDGNISLFPNPVDLGGTINIEFKYIFESELLVVLRDIHGKEFYSKVIVNIEDGVLIGIPIDGEIPAGIYLITASSENQMYSQKLIIR